MFTTAATKALDILEQSPEMLQQLEQNSTLTHQELSKYELVVINGLVSDRSTLLNGQFRMRRLLSSHGTIISKSCYI